MSDKASLYAQYLEERSFDHIIETERGFASYRYLNDGKSVYIVDIYVTPRARKDGVASALADTIVREALQKGCTELLGSVCPSAKGSTLSLKVLIGYGMTLHTASNDFIVFRKEIA
jgi:GNAT superfamily N-acetyltransferase